MPIEELLSYAKSGVVEAEFRIGFRYYNGLGVNRDIDTSIEWFKKAAKNGHKEAAYYLGLIYLQKQSTANPDLKVWYKTIEINPKNIKNESQAISIYDKVLDAHSKATKQNDSKAAYTLGLMFYSGSELMVNEEEALKWFELAYKLGHNNAQKYIDILKERVKTNKVLK